jgi:hypothetical protein
MKKGLVNSLSNCDGKKVWRWTTNGRVNTHYNHFSERFEKGGAEGRLEDFGQRVFFRRVRAPYVV